MNPFTLDFIDNAEQLKTLYEENRYELDHIKCLSALMPLMHEMMQGCNDEFIRSINYIQQYDSERYKLKQKAEVISNRIRIAIEDYYKDHGKKISDDLETFLKQSILRLNDKDILQHLNLINRYVRPIKGHLIEYGISSHLLHEINNVIHDILPAVPMNTDEITKHKIRFRSALHALKDLQLYLEYK